MAGLWPAGYVPARIVGDSNGASQALRPRQSRKTRDLEGWTLASRVRTREDRW
jgi:hypothetical protein